MSASRCDRCGEVLRDVDAGFSPGLHEMAHDCGGTWRVVSDAVGRAARIADLARSYAAEAVRAGGDNPRDWEGNSLLPTEPMPGDWAALDAAMPNVTPDEQREFERVYRAALEGVTR